MCNPGNDMVSLKDNVALVRNTNELTRPIGGVIKNEAHRAAYGGNSVVSIAVVFYYAIS